MHNQDRRYGDPLSRRAILAASMSAACAPLVGWPGRVLAQELLGDMRGALDAVQEGLLPGSPDDQSTGLMNALLKAGGEGRPLFLPPGHYELAGVELPPNAHLIGVPGQTRLAFRGGPFMLRARGSAALRLEGLVIDGRGLPLGNGEGLLFAESVDQVVIEDCAFLGSSASGATLRGCGGRVANSRFADARFVGLNLDMSRRMAALDNAVEACGDTGILVQRDEEGADDTILRGNRITGIRGESGGTGEYGNGINLDKANGVIISGNRLDDCAFSAIRCFSSDLVQVTGNSATNSGEMAIYVEFASEGAVVSDNIIDGAAYGISFANFAEHNGRLAVCSGNLVRNISGVSRLPRGAPLVGTGIGAEADVVITGNVIENSARGLQLGWGPYLRDITATGNLIRKCRIGVVVSVAEGAGSAVIKDNLIAGAETAIVGMLWEETGTGDLAKDGADDFPQLTIEGNRLS